MMHILDKARAAEVPVRKENFVAFGRSVILFEGVADWFDRIDAHGKQRGFKVEHYIISSGHPGDDRGHPHRPKVRRDIRLGLCLRSQRRGPLARPGRELHHQDPVPVPHQQRGAKRLRQFQDQPILAPEHMVFIGDGRNTDFWSAGAMPA